MRNHGSSRAAEDTLPVLIAERDRYQQWLDSLESERAQIPDHIYERIAADYADRLEKAIEALREHVGALEKRLEDRRVALAEVREALAAAEERFVESQVRHRIGELDSRRWQAIERSMKSAIVEAEHRRDELEAEVRRLQETIAQVRKPATSAVATGEALFLEALAEATGRTAGDAAGANGKSADGIRGDIVLVEPDPAASRPRKPAGHRTLRCATCGSFNLPEAMFCEACGGDLPAA